mgnify:CR=1 FL=1
MKCNVAINLIHFSAKGIHEGKQGLIRHREKNGSDKAQNLDEDPT